MTNDFWWDNLQLLLLENKFDEERFIERAKKYYNQVEMVKVRGLIKEFKEEMNFKEIYKGITPDMIEKARQYPIENLLEVKHGKALCFNHQESHPSMNCKNNYAFCHACGWKGSVIDVYMKLHDCIFQEAVKSLQ